MAAPSRPRSAIDASPETRGAARLRKRSVVLAGHRTSVSLEEAFWDTLKEIAAARGLSLNRLVAEVDGGRAGNLSGALRVFVLQELRRRT
jgi:predicted DNA-binding ribbon-helix-helix protein